MFYLTNFILGAGWAILPYLFVYLFGHLGTAISEHQDDLTSFRVFRELDKTRMELRWRGPFFTTPDGGRTFIAFGPIDYLRYLCYLAKH